MTNTPAPTVSPFVFPARAFRITDAFSPDRDGVSYSGRGEIIPSVSSVVVNGRTLSFASFEFKILADGSLEYVDESGVVHACIDLPANDVPELTLDSGLQYTARRWVSQGDVFVPLPDILFDTPSGGISTVSSLAPVEVRAGVPIIKGDKGDKGDTGATPRLVPGTLTAVPYDAPLSFDVVESEPGVYVVSATAPQGKQGEPGAPGQIGPAGMSWRGLWAADVDYVDADAVSYDGSSWFAADNPPLGEVPSAASAFWNVLSLHGAQGDRGPAGVDGANAPIPQITFTATTLPAGSDATVSQSGVYPAINVALGVPQGAAGTGGSGGGGSAEPVMEWRGYNNGFGGYTDTKGQVNNRYFFKRVGERVFCRFELTTALWYEQQSLINFYGGQMQGLRPLRDVVHRTANSWADGLEKKQASMVMKTDGGNCSVSMTNLNFDANSSQMVPYFFEFDYVTADPFPVAPTPTFFKPLPANASTADWAAI